MARSLREPVSEWTHRAAERVHGVNNDVRGRIHLAGEALLARRRARPGWLVTAGVFAVGVAVGVVAAISTRRRTLPPPEPAIAGTEDGAPRPGSAVPLETVETVAADQSQDGRV